MINQQKQIWEHENKKNKHKQQLPNKTKNMHNITHNKKTKTKQKQQNKLNTTTT